MPVPFQRPEMGCRVCGLGARTWKEDTKFSLENKEYIWYTATLIDQSNDVESFPTSFMIFPILEDRRNVPTYPASR